MLEEAMIPHGQAVTVTAPAAFRFTAPIWPEKHAHAAALLGANTPRNMPAMTLSGEITQLMKDIEFPNGLNALGFSEADIPQIVEGTLKQQRLLIGCPRKVGEKELTRIAKASMTLW